MAMCEQTNRQIMLAEQRAKNENQRRLILGCFTKPRMFLSIDEIAFQTKIQRLAVIKRLNDCPWFASYRSWGMRTGHHQMTAVGREARRKGLHLQIVLPRPIRPVTEKRAAMQQGPPNPNWHQPDSNTDYIPNEEQIQAAIAEIQATWDDEERWKRRTSLAEPLG